MKDHNFRPPIPSASADFTKAAAIAIAGASGSGKTESAMRLARGYCGAEPFVVVDTEEKRALYKKERHQPWDWLDFQPPFTPERTAAILDSVKGYRAVILDSTSMEYAGEGGISDIAEDELEKMAKGDAKAMERLIAPSWKHAKRRHKREFMAALIRYPTLIICCLRAEPKVKFLKEKFTRGDGSVGEKTVIVDAGYQPICEKMFMYEMLASFMMYAENAGVPEQVKALEEDLRPVFIPGTQIDEDTGRRLAAWANGSKQPAPQEGPQAARPGANSSPPTSPAAAGHEEPPVDPMAAKALEHAEGGTYAKFWNSLGAKERELLVEIIGEEKHAKYADMSKRMTR